MTLHPTEQARVDHKTKRSLLMEAVQANTAITVATPGPTATEEVQKKIQELQKKLQLQG